MSVIIKGMKIPGSCFDCPCSFNMFICRASGGREIIDDDSSVNITRGSINISRPHWCPMIDLGNHGNLIDEDELKEHMQRVKLDFSVQYWIDAVDLNSKVHAILKAEKED